jgi:small-conductance mechanosensitive channel
MNPTVRGFLVIVLIVLVIVVLQLQATLVSLYLIASIAFFLAIAFVAFLFWRERRSDIQTWPTRAQIAFYGGAAVIVAALGAYFWPGRATRGLDLVAFLVTLGIAGFAMFRTWRDQHSYI